MTMVGWLLVAGFFTFMVGAAGWRIEYQQPLERSLPVMHADRRRLRWIHWWMIPAVTLTTVGLGGLAIETGTSAAGVAATATPWAPFSGSQPSPFG